MIPPEYDAYVLAGVHWRAVQTEEALREYEAAQRAFHESLARNSARARGGNSSDYFAK